MPTPHPNTSKTSICHYLVVVIDGVWWIDCEGRPFGPMKTKEEVISSGIHLISVLGDPDRPADIWAPDDAGKSRLVWKSSERS